MLMLAAQTNQPNARSTQDPPSPSDDTSHVQEEYDDGFPVDEPTHIDVQVELACTVRKYSIYLDTIWLDLALPE